MQRVGMSTDHSFSNSFSRIFYIILTNLQYESIWKQHFNLNVVLKNETPFYDRLEVQATVFSSKRF